MELSNSNVTNQTDELLYGLFSSLWPSDLAINIEYASSNNRSMPLLSNSAVAVSAFLSTICNSLMLEDELQLILKEQLDYFFASNDNLSFIRLMQFTNKFQIYICISDLFNFDLFEHLEGIAPDIKSHLRLVDEEKVPSQFITTSLMFNTVPRDNKRQQHFFSNCPNCNYVDYRYGMDGVEVIKNMFSPWRIAFAAIRHSPLPLVTGAAIDIFKAIKYSSITTPLLKCCKCNDLITICPSCKKYISHQSRHPNFRNIYKCPSCNSNYKVCGRSTEYDSFINM